MSEYIADLVSVVIPTYRRSDSLIRAITSVKNQTYPDIEIIVVNDNQVGDEFSLDLYKKMSAFESDDNVFLVEQEKHINGAAARNAGIKRAKGEYIAFLDDDDYWDSHKIEHQIKVLKSLDSSWGAVGCLTIHVNGRSILHVGLPYKDGNVFHEVLQRTVGLGTGSLLMRRASVDETGYFDESLKRHQDIQFFGYFCSKYKVKLLKEYLYYVDHKDASNRPDVNSIKKVKQDFYQSVKPLIDSMSNKEKNKFFIMNDFEIGVVEWRSGYKSNGMKKMIRIFRYPSTAFKSLKRILRRISGKKFKNLYLRKYAQPDNNIDNRIISHDSKRII